MNNALESLQPHLVHLETKFPATKPDVQRLMSMTYFEMSRHAFGVLAKITLGPAAAADADTVDGLYAKAVNFDASMFPENVPADERHRWLECIRAPKRNVRRVIEVMMYYRT